MPRAITSKISRNKEGARLKNLRCAMGMNMRELAKEFNVAIGSISQWENGEHTIPGPVLKLIEIYEIPEIVIKLVTKHEKKHVNNLKKPDRTQSRSLSP